jgi:hypothetical protein
MARRIQKDRRKATAALGVRGRARGTGRRRRACGRRRELIRALSSVGLGQSRSGQRPNPFSARQTRHGNYFPGWARGQAPWAADSEHSCPRKAAGYATPCSAIFWLTALARHQARHGQARQQPSRLELEAAEQSRAVMVWASRQQQHSTQRQTQAQVQGINVLPGPAGRPLGCAGQSGHSTRR